MRSRSTRSWRELGRAMRVRNFRRFMLGQAVSQLGQWFQTTAEMWFIFAITGSGTALGLHAVLRFGPILLLGTYGGLIADRIDRHKLLIATQLIQCAAVTALVVVVAFFSPTLPIVYGIVTLQGLVNLVDNPLRRSFTRDLISDEDLASAVSVNGMLGTTARAIGPALAGLTIAGVGVKWCFAINAVSYMAVLFSLFSIDRRLLRPATLVRRAPGQLREGFRYSWRNHRIRVTLILTGVVSTFAWNWQVLLPVYATEELGGSAALYGALVSLISVGSLIGALGMASLARPLGRHLLAAAVGLAMALWATAAAPALAIAAIALVLLGVAGSSFTVGAQTRLQLNTDDAMSGRVMALYSVGFAGTKPIGGMLGGWLTDLGSSRLAFAVGGGSVAAAAAMTWVWNRRRRAGCTAVGAQIHSAARRRSALPDRPEPIDGRTVAVSSKSS